MDMMLLSRGGGRATSAVGELFVELKSKEENGALGAMGPGNEVMSVDSMDTEELVFKLVSWEDEK